MNKELQEYVIETLKKSCGVDGEIHGQSRLLEDLKLDSMGMLALAISLENHYRVKLGENPDTPPKTVADVVALLEKRLESEKK